MIENTQQPNSAFDGVTDISYDVTILSSQQGPGLWRGQGCNWSFALSFLSIICSIKIHQLCQWGRGTTLQTLVVSSGGTTLQTLLVGVGVEHYTLS